MNNKGQQKILLAGATGYLGKHILAEMINRELNFKLVVRNPDKLSAFDLSEEQIIKAEVTDLSTMKDCCRGIDIVISTVGITRQKDGLSYMDVDFQGNLNLLREAEKVGVKKMIYISAINGEVLRELEIFKAKEGFVEELQASDIQSTVIRPNAFFSDMRDFLEMAKRGVVFLFGRGDKKLNPIHGADLADFILDNLNSSNASLSIGGPDILSQNEIAALALDSWYKNIRIIHLPDWSRRFILFVLRRITSSRFYGPYEFFLSAMAIDNVAPRFGKRRLYAFFSDEIGGVRNS